MTICRKLTTHKCSTWMRITCICVGEHTSQEVHIMLFLIMEVRRSTQIQYIGTIFCRKLNYAFLQQEGFCIFSDIAVAANVLLQQYSPSSIQQQKSKDLAIRRILIIDLDVHQGNGNAAIFAGDNRVKTFSLHCKGNYFSKREVSVAILQSSAYTEDEHVRYCRWTQCKAASPVATLYQDIREFSALPI